MSERAIHLDGDSAELVAYLLLLGIAMAEKKTVTGAGVIMADRQWLLSTYAECLNVAKPNNEA